MVVVWNCVDVRRHLSCDEIRSYKHPMAGMLNVDLHHWRCEKAMWMQIQHIACGGDATSVAKGKTQSGIELKTDGRKYRQ